MALIKEVVIERNGDVYMAMKLMLPNEAEASLGTFLGRMKYRLMFAWYALVEGGYRVSAAPQPKVIVGKLSDLGKPVDGDDCDCPVCTLRRAVAAAANQDKPNKKDVH